MFPTSRSGMEKLPPRRHDARRRVMLVPAEVASFLCEGEYPDLME